MERRPEMEQQRRKDRYAFIVYGLEGVGAKTFLGIIKDEEPNDAKKRIEEFREEMAEYFPRGIGYEMMAYEAKYDEIL